MQYATRVSGGGGVQTFPDLFWRLTKMPWFLKKNSSDCIYLSVWFSVQNVLLRIPTIPRIPKTLSKYRDYTKSPLIWNISGCVPDIRLQTFFWMCWFTFSDLMLKNIFMYYFSKFDLNVTDCLKRCCIWKRRTNLSKNWFWNDDLMT